MNPDTLTRLLRGEHLDMNERRALGVWPHPPLRFAEVREHLVNLLRAEEFFPRAPQSLRPGAPRGEGITIERRGKDHFVCRARRHHTVAPTVLAAESERTFDSAQSAADHYLRWELRLPGDLDGWKVVE